MSFTLTEAAERLADIREGKKVVLTAGTFDILHPGHITFLDWCKSQGDLLTVCIIGDRRTRRRKGPERPIVSERTRALLLSALKPVDAVFISNRRPFEEPIIRMIRPDIVITSADEPSRTKKEAFASYFRARHPEIRLVMRKRSSFRNPYSSKKIIRKILESV